MKTTLSRRTFLRGTLGGVGLALAVPPLQAMLTSRGAYAAGGDDRFFILFFWGGGLPWHDIHGTKTAGHPDLWTPSMTGPGYAPSELLAPLAGHQVNVVTGLEPATSDSPTGDGHMRGFMTALTGEGPRVDGFDHPSHTLTAKRPTLDQLVAKHPAFYKSAPARYRSLEVGVSPARFHTYGHWNAISYNGPDSTNEPIMQPTQLFDRLFSVTQDLNELADRSRALDAVLDDARDLQRTLGVDDRKRIDAHLEHVSSIQRRLSLGASCQKPARPSDGGDLIAKTKTMAELLAQAIVCGQTRVSSMMLTSPATTHVFSNLGVDTDFHTAIHGGMWDGARAVTLHQMTAFKAFLDAFAAVSLPQGGTLLDAGVVYGTSEYGEGYNHSVNELPVVVAGGAGGALRKGTHVRLRNGNVSRAQLTVLQALGLPFTSFGFDGGETSAPIAELVA